MIFQRFLKKKPPGAQAAPDSAALGRAARDSADIAARRDACRRLTSLRDLREIAAADQDAGVREIVQARYRNLLCGTDEPRLPVEERLRELAAIADERLLEQVATTAHEPELRRAAIDRLTTATVLCNCALRDPLSTNRCAAVERIADKAALEQIARQIGKKDKRVYRLAREKLKEIAEQEALPRRIRNLSTELCEKIERLGRFGHWEQERGLLDLIDREWAGIAAEADEDHRTRYRDGRERFLADYEQYRQQNASQLAAERAQAERRATLDALLEELAAVTGLDDETAVAELCERAGRIWQDGLALPHGEQARRDERFAQAMAAATRHQALLAQRQRRTNRMHALQDAIAAALAQNQPLDQAQTGPLIAEAQTLTAGESPDTAQAEALRQAAAALEQRLLKQRRHAEQRLAQLQPKLEALTASLADGELKRAEPLMQSLQAGVDLAQASGLPRQTYAALLQHIQQAAPRIKELQGWRRWGADQQREALCQAVDELLVSEVPAEILATQLREQQMAWKALDQGGAPADHRRWERFHAAAERVYERCRPYLEQQAAEREANRRAREQLCGELETFLDSVDWERMDWKKAVKAEREMRRSWAGIGPVEGRHRKGLERRFHTAIKRLDRYLDAERARNRRYREDLIAEVAALADLPDLDRAIERTKDCQRRWHTTVAGRKSDENALWQRFRDASDRVFSRRRAQIEAHEAELQDNLTTRTAICDEAKTLASTEGSPHEIELALRNLEQRWRDTASLSLPRQAAKSLNERWHDARQGVLDGLRQRRAAARRQTLDLLALQAELCTRVEQAAIDGECGRIDLPAIQVAWAELPRQQDETLQAAIGARFATGLAMLERGDPVPAEVLADNQQEREGLCLQLEILAQVDSPAELANERLAFQIARLTERMAAGEKDPLASAAGLLPKWYLCGPAPAAPDLEQRFARVRAVLERGHAQDEAA